MRVRLSNAIRQRLNISLQSYISIMFHLVRCQYFIFRSVPQFSVNSLFGSNNPSNCDFTQVAQMTSEPHRSGSDEFHRFCVSSAFKKTINIQRWMAQMCDRKPRCKIRQTKFIEQKIFS